MELRDVMGSGPSGVEVSALAYDDRAVGPGALFFCVPGRQRDGHDFAGEAVRRGAVALVVQRRLPELASTPQVQVADVRAAMAPAAARFHRDPSASLDVVAVTGTNGKTTTAFLVRALLEAVGRPCGLLGTVTAVVGGRTVPVVRTTPEAVDLQRVLSEMVAAGDEACALEISSHALELGRADALAVSVAVFTNVTQDHLDFHPTIEHYFQAKRRLFTSRLTRRRVVNIDDAYGARLAAELKDTVTVGIDAPRADYRVTGLETGLGGSRFTVKTPEGTVELRSPLPGRFNVANVLGAVAAARLLGVELAAIAEALPDAGRVPGRFEPVDEGQGFAVLVDYAHTPDGLENVLRAARGLSDGRVICVFGCGGDRDRAKRPLMGEIARRLADLAIVTSDNPRSEEPEAIIADILAGAGPGVEVHPDRRLAIGAAIESAAPGDVVVVAGKGHEQGQELAHGVMVPFDDATVARQALGRHVGPTGR